MARDTNATEAAEVEKPTAEKEPATADKDFEDSDGSDLFDDSDEEEDEDSDEDTDSDETDEDAEDGDDDETEEEEAEAEEPADETEPKEEKKSKKGEKSTEATVENKIKIKYDGKEREIDPFGDEAKELIQKGLNHARLSEKLAERDRILTEYGKANGGLTAEDALKTLLTSANAAMEAQELESLKKQYPNSDEAVLAALAKANASAKALTMKQTAEETESAKRLQELQKEYPQYAKIEDLPKEVQTAIAGGKTPLQAVKDAEIAKLTKQVADLQKNLEAAKQNKKNRDTSLPPAKGASKDRKRDAFEDAIGV